MVEMPNKRDAEREAINIRDAAIHRRYIETFNASVVAKEFGLSRERVRQILQKFGIERSLRTPLLERQREEIKQMIDDGMVPQQIAKETGLPRNTIQTTAAALGIKDKLDKNIKAQRHEELQEAIEIVKDGGSIHSAVGGDHAKAMRLSRVLGDMGIQPKSRSRHLDYSHRIPIMKKMLLEENRSWREIADAINEVEAKMGLRPITVGAVVQWARNYFNHD